MHRQCAANMSISFKAPTLQIGCARFCLKFFFFGSKRCGFRSHLPRFERKRKWEAHYKCFEPPTYRWCCKLEHSCISGCFRSFLLFRLSGRSSFPLVPAFRSIQLSSRSSLEVGLLFSFQSFQISCFSCHSKNQNKIHIIGAANSSQHIA